MATKLYTIGHSNHSLKEFLDLLQAYKITHLVDIRTIPKSRYVPWFNQTALKDTLRRQKIPYTHTPLLGGFRQPKENSINTGWKNSSFRGFADYMLTPEFFLGLKALNQIVKQEKRVAIMCAEALPWRCHRSLIADAEVIRHIKVEHIINVNLVRSHELTAFALVDRVSKPFKIYYPDA